tara:strand:- start:391 stop:1329 length:939 start_codon:yes stop_codon:yes gene_type:complete
MINILKNLYRSYSFYKVPKKIKLNFVKLTKNYEENMKTFLVGNYFRNETEINEQDLEDHIKQRINLARSKILPWVLKTIDLKNKKLLEVGSGTGSSSIAFSEQGAIVTGIDVDATSIEVAKYRSNLLNQKIEYINISGIEIKQLENNYDVILYYACLEHMTVRERIDSLQQAYAKLNKYGFLVIVEAPNRLWIEDTHTSELPFFQWLPDDLAYLYSKFSPKGSFNSRYTDNELNYLAEFHRRGRGVSYHEFDLAFENYENLEIVSSLNRLVYSKNLLNTFLYKKIYKLYLKKFTNKNRAFVEEYLDLIIQKK